MKKIKVIIISILAVCIMFSTMVSAQDNQTQVQETEVKKPAKMFKVDEKFLTAWTQVEHLTKEIRSFKTEKAVTVAGVRGVEAVDELLRLLYFKGGILYPNQNALINAIDMLEAYVKENPNDSTVVDFKYYIAQCSIQLGDTMKLEDDITYYQKAIDWYEDIIKNHPKSEYAVLAKEELNKIKKSE